MNCPDCKRPAIAVSDGAHVVVRGKRKEIPGWFCDWCCRAWVSATEMPKNKKLEKALT